MRLSQAPHHSSHVRTDEARDVYCESNSIPELDSLYLRNDIKAIEISLELFLELSALSFGYFCIIESFAKCVSYNLFISGRYFFFTAMRSPSHVRSNDDLNLL